MIHNAYRLNFASFGCRKNSRIRWRIIRWCWFLSYYIHVKLLRSQAA